MAIRITKAGIALTASLLAGAFTVAAILPGVNHLLETKKGCVLDEAASALHRDIATIIRWSNPIGIIAANSAACVPGYKPG